MGIYGITTLQTYFYFLNYPYDTKSFKLLVALVWLVIDAMGDHESYRMYNRNLDTIHSIFST